MAPISDMSSVWSKMSSTLVHQGLGMPIIAGFILIVLYLAFNFSVEERPYKGFPLIGSEGNSKDIPRAKQQWVTGAMDLIYDGLRVIKGPFQIISDAGPLLILPPSYMEEIRNNDNMTFKAWLKKNFFTTYPGFEGYGPAVQNNVFAVSVRTGLTQSLFHLSPLISRETSHQINEMWSTEDGWHTTSPSEDALKIIARVSSAVFLPEPICFDKDWLKLAVEYTEDFFRASYALRLVPALTRPLVHWWLPATVKLRHDVKLARQLIEPVYAARLKEEAEATKAGRIYEKPNDALTWLEAASVKEKTPTRPVEGVLNFVLGAVHTTGGTLTTVIYDLVEHPEYVEPLREELRRVLKEDGGWAKNTLSKLKLMDSFMRESRRLNPATMMPVNRVAETTFTLKDGTVIPANATVGLPATLLIDPTRVPNPLHFDGYRSYHLRQQPGNESKYQFVTTSNDDISFGHGKHSCAGRFYAACEIKIAMAHLLLKYDLKFPDGKGRPEMLKIGADRVQNPEGRIMYRRRKWEEAVGLMSARPVV